MAARVRCRMAPLSIVFLLICMLTSAYYTESRASGIIKQLLSSSWREEEEDHRPDREEPEYDTPHYDQPEYDKPDYDRPGYSPFILERPMKVIRTDAGEVRALPREPRGELMRNNIGLSFIRMEPKALLLPQYIDADWVFVVYKGKARLSWVDGNDLRETDLEVGDVYRVKGGTAFYIFNQDEGQRLSIFSIFDTSKVLRRGVFQSFFVAGGYDPPTILAGFDDDVIATAMRVSREEVKDILNSQNKGPIIFSPGNSTTEVFDITINSAQGFGSLLRKYLRINAGDPPKPYNILKKSPDFQNNNGWTVAVTGKEFPLLRRVDLGVYSVSLKAGAMLAPHWNPRAAEIGLITKGEGIIQIAFPNGTKALNKRVTEGTVFFVPQYHPMCQIASRSGPLEFMGFTTSARNNHPQFLAGPNSVLRVVKREILAAAMNVPADRLANFLESQQEAVILPGKVDETEEGRQGT